MQPRIRIKSELLECRERLSETKARNDQKSNISQFQILHCIRMKISNRHHRGGHDFKATKMRERVVRVRLI